MRTVAAFDFDGTLTRRDTVVPFLMTVCGPVKIAAAAAAISPWLVGAALDERRREDAKERLLRRTVAGRSDTEMREAGRQFADDIVARRLRDDARARITWHRGQDHELVLVSASLTHYLDAVAEQLGFDAVLATELEVGPDGRLTGGLVGANVRGPEKVRRLEEWLGDDQPAFVWAYGDSAGDRDLLARADRSQKV
ncbi:MAG: HAD-IB family hydrolase [Acidimicrobiia bacterium]